MTEYAIKRNTVYVPKDGELFYTICLDGRIVRRKFDGKDDFHVGLLHMRNCFKSEKRAIEARTAVRAVMDAINVEEPIRPVTINIRL